MVDYSRWNRIEISDDEDDTHPNIDTGSLFRWRHQARLERMAKQQIERAELEEKESKFKEKVKNFDTMNNEEMAKLREEEAKLKKERADLERRERMQPWNVDTISRDSWSKTLINRQCLQKMKEEDQEMADMDRTEEISEEHVNRYAEFIEQYEPKIKEFAFYSRFEDIRRFLLENPNIVSQYTLDYMMLWCLQLKLDEKQALLDHVARQVVCLQMILDLAKTVKGCDPRSCLPSFFTKAKTNWVKFQRLWDDELEDFKQRIEKGAEMRIEHAVQKQLESKEKLIGPGGLDAQEVFDSLPDQLKECFETRNVQLLHECLSAMDPEEADYHMQRCIDAGLWVTDKKSLEDDEDEKLLRKITELQASASVPDPANDGDDEDEEEEEAYESECSATTARRHIA